MSLFLVATKLKVSVHCIVTFYDPIEQKKKGKTPVSSSKALSRFSSL